MSAKIALASREPTRRRFIEGLALVSGAAVVARPTWSRALGTTPNPAVLSGETIDLRIGATAVNVTGRRRMATTVNGTLPAHDPAPSPGSERHDQCRQHLARARFDPLAWPSPAQRHGRRAGTDLPWHRARRDLHLPISDRSERDLLLSQSLRDAGADWSLWRARIGSARKRNPTNTTANTSSSYPTGPTMIR